MKRWWETRFFVYRTDFWSKVEHAMVMNIAGAPSIYMKLNAARKAFAKKVTTRIRVSKMIFTSFL